MEETHSPAKQLEHLRSELRPVYGEHTDSVISMVGLTPHKSVLEALKQGDLTEAEAAHYLHFRSPAAQECNYCPSGERKFNHRGFAFGNKVPNTPKWLDKPLKPAAKKLPTVEISQEHLQFDRFSSPGENRKIIVDGKVVGNAAIQYEGKHGSRIIRVVYLQQYTRRLSSGEARKLEGWKNAFMEELEKEARRSGTKKIMFSTGSHHIQLNISSRPIHPEILETYGRLPMQHGYTLEPTEQYAQSLWWAKELQ